MMQLMPKKAITRFFSSAILLSFCFVNLNGWQVLSLENLTEAGGVFSNDSDQVVKGPGNALMEHAILDYQHYYSARECDNCASCSDQKLFDVSISPFFEYLQVKGNKNAFKSYGGFVQAQFNWGKFWIRANDLFGQTIEKENVNKKERKSIGADDVIVKVGYDICRDNDKHFGLYLLGGFPTNRSLKAQIVEINAASKLILNSPALGSKNFRAGGGLSGAYAIFDSGDFCATFLCDMQYSYAIPATYTNDFVSGGRLSHTVVKYKNEKDEWKIYPYLVNGEGYTPIEAWGVFSPGHSIINWFGLHMTYGKFNVEVGGEFELNLGKEIKIKAYQGKKMEELTSMDPLLAPSLLLTAQPYVAFSYNTHVGCHSIAVGLGCAYRHDESVVYGGSWLDGLEANVVNGFGIWGTLALGF